MNPPDWGMKFNLQNAAAATGNGNDMLVHNYGGALLNISGTFVGTITFEASSDGTNWYAVKGKDRTPDTSATTATAPSIVFVALQGLSHFRARISAYTSGNITVDGIPVPIYST